MVKLIAFSIVLCSIGTAFTAFSSLQTHRHVRSSDECQSFVEGPFAFCSAAGYYDTFEFPAGFTGGKLQAEAIDIWKIVQSMNCSQNTLAVTMACSYFVPECSKGKRVYPCKRVCNEFLNQCELDIPEFFSGFLMVACHDLPGDKASNGKCNEPPNFTTNDSIPGPLARGCQEMIIPVCKNLQISNYTFISFELQRKLYKFAYNKEYTAVNVEEDFPRMYKQLFEKYPKCQDNLKKLICGEFLPPCFPDEPEGPGYYTICRSVCEEITRDCPDFFRDNYPGAEYCSFAGKENTSHGFCRRREWPPPFAWARYFLVSEKSAMDSSTKGLKTKGLKVWNIVVPVVVLLIIATLILGGAIWWKQRSTPSQSRYTKQADERRGDGGALSESGLHPTRDTNY